MQQIAKIPLNTEFLWQELYLKCFPERPLKKKKVICFVRFQIWHFTQISSWLHLELWSDLMDQITMAGNAFSVGPLLAFCWHVGQLELMLHFCTVAQSVVSDGIWYSKTWSLVSYLMLPFWLCEVYERRTKKSKKSQK